SRTARERRHGIRLPEDAGLHRLLLHSAPLLAFPAASDPLRRRPPALGARERGRCGSAGGGHEARLSAASDSQDALRPTSRSIPATTSANAPTSTRSHSPRE